MKTPTQPDWPSSRKRSPLSYVEGNTVGELIEQRVDIIVAGNAPAAVAASKVTRTIPIVLTAVDDPVGLG